MVAVFEGDVPAQTRPYRNGNNYLKIINRGNERREADLRRPVLLVAGRRSVVVERFLIILVADTAERRFVPIRGYAHRKMVCPARSAARWRTGLAPSPGRSRLP